MEVIGKLTREEFFYWKASVVNLLYLKESLKTKQLEHTVMARDLEIQRLKFVAFKANVDAQAAQVTIASDEYESVKQLTEQSIGFSLNDCAIDEITFEIKKLDT